MESDRGKLFVGGVTRDTTEATLKAHFEKYGAVSGSAISKDPATSIPRGFGFVCFFDPSAADRALQDTHKILGRQVDVKRARPRRQFPNPRNEQRPPPSPQLSGASSFDSSNSQFRTTKIFVGGLAASVTELEFKNYFERFGRVNDVVVMIDMATHRPRGFGFITFDSEESVENAMQQNFHELGGKFVEVKKAVPKDEYYSNKSGRGYQPAVNHPVYARSPPPTYGVLPTPAPYNGYGGFTGGAGVYGGWYPSGGYAGLAYGISPIVPQAFMFPAYGGNSFYPAYMSGGSWATAADGYNLYNRVPGQGVYQLEHTAADLKSSGDDGGEA